MSQAWRLIAYFVLESFSFIIIIPFAGFSDLSGLRVSDAKGWIGAYTYGFTVSANPNSNSSCWDSAPPKPYFKFSTYPDRLAQCEQTRVYWNADEVQGNPTFLPIVLNGPWSPLTPGLISDVPGYGRGFIWRPPIVIGAVVVLVAGDIHGNATGGAMVMTVESGTQFTNMTADPMIGQCPPLNGTGITYPVRNDSSSSSTAKTAIGVVLGVVSIFVALAIFLFVKRRRRQRQNTTPVITTPTVTESKRDEMGIHGQGLPGGQLTYYLPELMTSPNPATWQAQLEPLAGQPLYYPFPDGRTDTPSTGKGEVIMQPKTTHTGIYTGTGTGTDVPQRPWSATGTGMSGDSIVYAPSNSPNPTRGPFGTQWT